MMLSTGFPHWSTLLLLLLVSPNAVVSRMVGRTLKQAGRLIVVDQSGEGNYRTIQGAIDSIADGNTMPVTLQINAGIYQERVVVPISKPFIRFQGAGMGATIIEWNLKASDIGSNGQALTAYNTASITILASDFIAMDMGFQNTQPPPPPGVDGQQAAALKISGDRAAFYRCGFFGAQDTLCDDEGRHYFESCFIEGSIDFIFGNGRSLYRRCQLRSIANLYGSIAAQDRQSPYENTGFSFVACNVTGSGPLYLGRAMGPYSRTIFAYSYLEGIVDPRGWDDWDHDTTKDLTVYFGQYKCFGPGAQELGRVSWSHELSDEEAQEFLDASFIDGIEWLQDYEL